MKTCTIDGCDRKHVARGLCSMHWKREHGTRTTYLITCEVCGAEHQASRPTQRFCGDACKGAAYKTERARQCALPPDHPVMVAILLADDYRVKPTFRKVFFRNCVTCGGMFTSPHAGVVTCGTDCFQVKRLASRSLHRNKRRGRIRTTRAEDGLHWRKLYREDGPACHLCGYDTDPNDYKTVVGSDGRPTIAIGLEFPTLDHLVPLSRGGEHTRANARLAHSYCNAVKNDQPALAA